jgi:hypothetical protein
MEFKIGDKVKFVGGEEGYVPKYFSNTSEIDDDILQHGTTRWDGSECEVKGIKNGYVAVKHRFGDKIMCLAYKPENLVLLNKFQNNKMDSDTLKGFSPKNLADAKKLAEDELAQTEINTAKAVYLELAKKKREEESKIKDANTEIKEIDKQLGVFNKK